MKKIFVLLEVCIIITFSVYLCIFSRQINLTKSQNINLYQEFVEKNYIDANGIVNISEVKSIHDETYEKINTLFENTTDTNTLTQQLENMKQNNTSSETEIDTISKEISELTTEVNSLEEQYNILNNKYQKIKKEKELMEQLKNDPSGHLISNFETINQYPNYPTGCESVAITLLLHYYGIAVSVDNIINNLARESLPYWENDKLYGGNPEIGFLGNPYSNGAYGVYENPIANVANIYKNGVVSRSNFPFSEVLNLVSQDKPVVVWTSMGLAIPFISQSWLYKPTGETINWIANEHAVVVIGYNNNYVIISDPMGGQIKYQSRSVFESRYQDYGKKVVYYP